MIRNIAKSDEGTYKCTATNIFPGEAVAFAHLVIEGKKNGSLISDSFVRIQFLNQTFLVFLLTYILVGVC